MKPHTAFSRREPIGSIFRIVAFLDIRVLRLLLDRCSALYLRAGPRTAFATQFRNNCLGPLRLQRSAMAKLAFHVAEFNNRELVADVNTKLATEFKADLGEQRWGIHTDVNARATVHNGIR